MLSCFSHAASVLFARKPDGATWGVALLHYRELNASSATQRSVELVVQQRLERHEHLHQMLLALLGEDEDVVSQYICTNRPSNVTAERCLAVYPRKVAAIAEWAMPTLCTDVRRFVGRSLPRWAPPPLPLAGAINAPPSILPAGYTVEAPPPGDLGAALVGTMLNWWPNDGWQRGTVACPCHRGDLWHVVADVDAARHGGHAARRRVLRLPLAASLAGPRCRWARALRLRAASATCLSFKLVTVGHGGSSGPFGPGPDGQRTGAWNVMLMPASAAFFILAEDSGFTNICSLSHEQPEPVSPKRTAPIVAPMYRNG